MDLGKKINKTKQQIEKYEKGDFVPLPIIEKIAVALDAPIKKKIIRKISNLRKIEIETQQTQEELIDWYNEILQRD